MEVWRTAARCASPAPALVDGARDGRDAVHKLGAEDDVGVAEHALLERDHDELGVGEVRFDHAPDVLRVAQVQCGIHLGQGGKAASMPVVNDLHAHVPLLHEHVPWVCVSRGLS